MYKILRSTLALLLALGVSSSLYAQPANDNCEDAIELSGVVTDEEFSTVDATTDGPDHPNDCVSSGSTGEKLYNDIWYRWTAGFTGEAQLSLCSTADFDTKIAIYAPGSACPPMDSDLIGCNEDGGGCDNFTSLATFDVVAGETYLLRIGGWGDGEPGEEGTGTFFVGPSEEGPVNDFCENAIELDLGEEDFIELEIDTRFATTSLPRHFDAQLCFEDDEEYVYKDVWFRWTATFTAGLELSTCGLVNFDSRVAAYASTTCPPDTSTLVGCGDDDVDEDAINCPNFTSRALFNVEEGTTYLLRVGGWGTSDPGDSGFGTVIVRRIPPLTPPENDACGSAVPASVITVQQADDFDILYEGFTANASPQPIIPNPSCDNDGEFWDVWYSFNSGPNTELSLRFNKITLNADFIIDLYSSCTTQADLDGGTFCTITEGLSETYIDVPITGLPGEPTDYLLRVSSNVRDVAPGEFWFQLVGETAVSGLDELAVEDFRLFPNPVKEEATVSFFLHEATEAQVEILNTLGQVVQRQDYGQLAAGKNRFQLSTANLDPGIYFFRLLAEGRQKTVRFVKQ